MNLSNEIPEDFIATNSNDSPKLPKVIMEEMSKAMGKANATNEALAYQRK